jgi:arsenate reductase
MMSIKIYEFKNCDTCRKALQYLDQRKISYLKIAIVDQPPTLAELKKMLSYIKSAGGTFKNLFNTSGVQYRELNISDKIKSGMTENEALELLSKNGKLIKRPFLLTNDAGVVGFKKEIWEGLKF